MRVRHVGPTDQAGFIFDHLEGEAWDEIKYRTVTEHDNPETVFTILKELYGCQKPYILLQEEFFSLYKNSHMHCFVLWTVLLLMLHTE